MFLLLYMFEISWEDLVSGGHDIIKIIKSLINTSQKCLENMVQVHGCIYRRLKSYLQLK